MRKYIVDWCSFVLQLVDFLGILIGHLAGPEVGVQFSSRSFLIEKLTEKLLKSLKKVDPAISCFLPKKNSPI